MVTVSDLKADLEQFKTATWERFDRLEKSLETMGLELQAEANKRHEELVKLLSGLAQSVPQPSRQAEPSSQPPPSTPPQTAAAIHTQTVTTFPLAILTASANTHAATKPHSNDLPPPLPDTVHPPLSSPRPSATTTPTNPPVIASKLLIEEFGLSIITTNRPPPLPGPYVTPLFGKGPYGYRIWNPGVEACTSGLSRIVPSP